MANIFANLPVPAGDGVGASVATDAFAARKTLTFEGTFTATITIEISQDNVDWAPLVSKTTTGKVVRYAAAAYMRVRVGGAVPGAAYAPNIDVGADRADGEYGALAVPAGNGAGAATDISAYPEFFSIIVAGAFTGGLTIEISQDGTDWAPLVSFGSIGVRHKKLTAAAMRVVRAGIDPALPGTPTVTIGATDEETTSSSGLDALVFQPGGTAGVGVYTSWANLYASLVAMGTDIPRTIIFDDRFTSPCVIPAGVYAMANVTWMGLDRINLPSQVQVADGASFTNLLTFDHVHVESLATATPCTLTVTQQIMLRNEADISLDAAAAPFYTGLGLAAGEFVYMILRNRSSIGLYGAVVNAITIPATASRLYVRLGEDCQIRQDAISSAASAQVYITTVATSAFTYPQPSIAGTYRQIGVAYQQHNLRPARGVVPSTVNIAAVAYGDWVRLNANAGVITQVLPAIAGAAVPNNDGRSIIISEEDGVNGVTVDANGVETINGALTYAITPGAVVEFISDGVSNWRAMAISQEQLLDRHNTFTEAQGTAKVTLADAATVATNAARSNVFEVVLGGNRILGLPTNLVSGFTYMWIIKQDGTGTRLLTYNAIFKFPGGTAPTLSTGINDVDIITAVYDGTILACVFQADFS